MIRSVVVTVAVRPATTRLWAGTCALQLTSDQPQGAARCLVEDRDDVDDLARDIIDSLTRDAAATSLTIGLHRRPQNADGVGVGSRDSGRARGSSGGLYWLAAGCRDGFRLINKRHWKSPFVASLL
jgi:hypothetical protein